MLISLLAISPTIIIIHSTSILIIIMVITIGPGQLVQLGIDDLSHRFKSQS